jgi:3-dehydrosphinganine reductase
MQTFFEGKRVWITGGSSGIGLALAKQFAALGAHVYIMARRENVLEEAMNEIQAASHSPEQHFRAVSVDVSDPSRVAQVANELMAAEGVPDILINSAGVVQPGLFTDLTPEDFQYNMDINFHGTVNVCRAVVPCMKARRSGHIVNISSLAGFLGTYGYTAYCASKYAVRGFSDALRAELKEFGIHLHLIFPPDTDTPQLVYDNAHKPFVTKELSGAAKALSADEVSRTIIKGITRRKYIITPGSDVTFYYYLVHFTGNLVYRIMDILVSMALRKERSAHHQSGEQECAHPDQIGDQQMDQLDPYRRQQKHVDHTDAQLN